jgi:energy-coupling factor transport system ATP-binding protein
LHITQYRHIASQYPRLVTIGDGGIIHHGAPLFEKKEKPVIDTSRSEQAARSTLAVSNLAFSHNEQRVFENLTFSLTSQEVLAVVGASGSGKSTLAMLLCGLLKPASGTIEVNGNIASNAVTMLFQFPEKQFFLPTSKQELAFGPSNYGKSATDTEINGWLQSVGLNSTYIERNPLSLSGGEKRRLAFALPFGLAAQFIIFDEPTAGLDEAGVTRFCELVALLKRKGLGVIIISHDGETVKSLADSVLVLTAKQQPKRFSASDFFAGSHWQGMLSTF